MTFRKPELFPLLFLIASLAVLCGLGSWQLERLAWKESLIDEAVAAQQAPLLENIPTATDELSYRHVRLRGVFKNEQTLHLVGSRAGSPGGFFMLTPFMLEDGRVILINRGFAPKDTADQPAGLQTVEGIIRPPREKRYFSPENQPEKNLWFYEDFTAMRAATGLDLLPLIVEATGAYKKGVFPIPHDGKVTFRNDHLGYAITWFSLAGVALVMFGLYYRRKATS